MSSFNVSGSPAGIRRLRLPSGELTEPPRVGSIVACTPMLAVGGQPGGTLGPGISAWTPATARVLGARLATGALLETWAPPLTSVAAVGISVGDADSRVGVGPGVF